MTECSIVILILFYYYLIHVKVIIESAFDSLLRLFILQRTDSASMHHDSHATEGIYSSLTAMIFNSLWTMYNLNLNLEATRGVWDVFGKCQCLEVLWLSDKVAGGLLWLMHGGDVMEEAFRVLFGTAVACSDNPQSNLTNWKEYTHSLFSLIRQQTAPEYLLQTSQMNELDSVNSGCRGQIFSDECCTNAKLKWIRWENRLSALLCFENILLQISAKFSPPVLVSDRVWQRGLRCMFTAIHSGFLVHGWNCVLLTAGG